MSRHQIFPLNENDGISKYNHEYGALESVATSVGISCYVYFIHKKTVIPRQQKTVLTVYDLWTGGNSEYKMDTREDEELKEFYELNENEAGIIVESMDELSMLHVYINHNQKEVIVLNRIQIIEKQNQEEEMNEYKCIRYERGLTVLTCWPLGIRVLELQHKSNVIDVTQIDIVYGGELFFLFTDPWREGDVIYCFESEPLLNSEEYRSFNGSLFTIHLSQREILFHPPRFQFTPALCKPDGAGTVLMVGVFHRPGHIWVVTQNSTQTATLNIWRLENDGWHLISDVENSEYDITMDVCVDGSALLILEDEVSGSPKMINIRFREVPTLFSLARCSTLKHFPALRCDAYLTHLFSKRLFR